MHAHVRHGAVVRYFAEVPFTFAGVRRFRSLSPGEQAAHGIVPVVDLTPAVNGATERLARAPMTVTVFPDRVEITRAVRAMTKDERDARAAGR